MGSKLLSLSSVWEGLECIRLQTFMKFCATRMPGGAFVNLVGSRLFEDESLSVVMLTQLTAGVFPASHGVRFSTV
ncbi:MAG: hypothetical protein JWM43_875 [Acidobacteriaceae bacterium]|nr:hypothetical protein [Acidobacteriaceae bacterium]